jgi:hypothetical protein
VRDCSCRGHSGFAHLPCLVKYAENMGGQALDVVSEESVQKMSAFFLKCSNCKQAYQNDLGGDMAKAFIAFNERLCPGDNYLRLVLQSKYLVIRLHSIDVKNETGRAAGKEIVSELISVIGEIRQKGCCPIVVDASIHLHIGEFFENMRSEDSLKRAKAFYEKARDIFISGGGEYDLDRRGVDAKIGRVESKLSGSGNGRRLDKAVEVEIYQEKYDCCIKRGNDDDTIFAGIKLASILFSCDRIIEAERLLPKLIAISRRVHGSDHNQTRRAVALLQQARERWIVLHSVNEWFEAIRYENDGDKCVIQGPIKDPRVAEEEGTFTVASTEVRPYKGTPVVLHGLKKAAHLNGKIGDVRDYCQSTDRYVVHLEDKGLKPVRAKHGNLRVVFDLPDPKNFD